MGLLDLALDTTTGPLHIPNASSLAAAVGPWTEAAADDASPADQTTTSPARTWVKARAELPDVTRAAHTDDVRRLDVTAWSACGSRVCRHRASRLHPRPWLQRTARHEL